MAMRALGDDTRRCPPRPSGRADRSLGGLSAEEEVPMPGLVRQKANFDLRMGDEIAIFGEEPI